MEEEKGVEASQSAPSDSAVENTTNAAGVDLVAEYAALFEENARIARDRDNYKAATLAAKKRGVDGDEIDRLVEDKLNAKLQELDIVKENEQKKAFVQKLMRENKELKLAVNNKPSDTPAGSSASSERDEASKSNFFSKEQLAFFEKRKFTPEDIKKVEQAYRARLS